MHRVLMKGTDAWILVFFSICNLHLNLVNSESLTRQDVVPILTITRVDWLSLYLFFSLSSWTIFIFCFIALFLS